MKSNLDLSSLIYDLKCINVFKQANLTKEQLRRLTEVMDVRPYYKDDVILRLRTDCEPALYVVLEGSVSLERSGMAPIMLPSGCNFGEELLKAAEWLFGDDGAKVQSPYTVTAARDNCICAVLTMQACRTVFDIDGIEKASDAKIAMKVVKKNPKGDAGKAKKAAAKEKGLKKVVEKKSNQKDKAAVVKAKKSKEKPSKETGAGNNKIKKKGGAKKKKAKPKPDNGVGEGDPVPIKDDRATTTKGGKSPDDDDDATTTTTSERGKLTGEEGKLPVSSSSNTAAEVTEPGGSAIVSPRQQPITGAETVQPTRDEPKRSEEKAPPASTDNHSQSSGHATNTKAEVSTPPPPPPPPASAAATTKVPEKGLAQRQPPPVQQPSAPEKQEEVDNDDGSKQKKSNQRAGWWGGWKGKEKAKQKTDQAEASQPTTVSQKLNAKPVIASQPSISDAKAAASDDNEKTSTPASREEAHQPVQRAFAGNRGGEQQDVGTSSSRPAALSQHNNDPNPTFEEKKDDDKSSEPAPGADDDQDQSKTLAVTQPDDAETISATAPASKEKLVAQSTRSLVQEDGTDPKRVDNHVGRLGWKGKPPKVVEDKEDVAASKDNGNNTKSGHSGVGKSRWNAKTGEKADEAKLHDDDSKQSKRVDAERVEIASLRQQNNSGADKAKGLVKPHLVGSTGSPRGHAVRNNKLRAQWPPQKPTISSSFLPQNSLSEKSALAKDEPKHGSPRLKKKATTNNHEVEDDAAHPRAPKPIDLAGRSMSPAESGESVVIAHSTITDTMVPNSTRLVVDAARNPAGQATEKSPAVESPEASSEDKQRSAREESAIDRLPLSSQDGATTLAPLKTETIDNVATATHRGLTQSIASEQEPPSQMEMGDEFTTKSTDIKNGESIIKPHCATIQSTAPQGKPSKTKDPADTAEPHASSMQSIADKHKEKKTDEFIEENLRTPEHTGTKTNDEATTDEIRGSSLQKTVPGPSVETIAPEPTDTEPKENATTASVQNSSPQHILSKSKDKGAAVEPPRASRASMQTAIANEHKASHTKIEKADAETLRESKQDIAPGRQSSGGADEAKLELPGRETIGQEPATSFKPSDDNTEDSSSSSESSRGDTGLDDSEVKLSHSNLNQQETSSSSGSRSSESESGSSEDESSTSPAGSKGKSLGDNKSSEGSPTLLKASENEKEGGSDSEASSSSSESLESSSSSESESASSSGDEESTSSSSESDESDSEYSWKIKPKRRNQSSSSSESESASSSDDEESSSSSSASDETGSGDKREVEAQKKERSKLPPPAHKSRNSEKGKPRNKGNDDSTTKPRQKRTDDRKTTKKSAETRTNAPPKAKKPKGGESKEQREAASHKPTKETREISSFLSARKKFQDQVPSQNASGKAPRPPKNVFQPTVKLPKDYESPAYPKSEAEVKNIQGALSKRFIFQNLPEKTTASLISAFEKKHVPAGNLVIKQGEVDDYFYIVSKGECQFEFDGVVGGEAKTGDSFGEDALVFLSPRDASVRTKADTELFRVDQTTFRSVLQNESILDEKDKRKILEKIPFLQGSNPETLRKLTSIMEPVEFKKGDTLTEANTFGDSFHVITQGKVKCCDVTIGNRPKEDRILKAGKYFGNDALVEDPFMKADVVALTTGKAYKIDRWKKDKLLPTTTRDPLDAGNFDAVKAFDRESNTRLKREEMLALSRIVQYETFAKGETIIEPDTEQEGIIYFLRKGKVHSWEGRRVMIVTPGTHFGEHVFLDARQKKQTTGNTGQKKYIAEEECVCATIRIQDYYEAFGDDFNRTASSIFSEPDSIIENKPDPRGKASKARHAVPPLDQEALPVKKKARRKIPMENVDKRVCLGEGAFGQVWLCSDKTESEPTPYVLKIMSKAHLVFEGEAEMCIREKNTMMELSHPFIVDLITTYNQEAFVFMLLEFVQGGELFSLMNSLEGRIQLKEDQAKLYALTIADAISHIHSKKFVYRDLKPENILIDRWGYAKVIDFGFAKKVAAGDKTFTICGTPGYLAPETIASQGHNWAVDHWALGVLIYEMLSTSSPFYYDGIEEMELFLSISEEDYPPLDNICSNAKNLISGLLEKDPRNRLGSLANGDKDILQHAWFKGLSITKLRSRQIKAPWKPKSSDPFDTSNFDDWSDLEDKMLDEGEPLSKHDAALFDGF